MTTAGTMVQRTTHGATEPHLVRETIRLRLAMMLVNDLIKQKAFRVPIHLALGHEAIAVAVSAVMESDDRLLLTHRNIHYNIARNASLRSAVGEYRLSGDGLGGGRFGAMNLTNPDRGIAYTASILGNGLPVAVGVAKCLAMRKKRAATIVVTGDGAIEEGAFYEALMMARSLSLPVVFLIENNGWSMYTHIEERRCALDLGQMAAAFGISYTPLTGGDPADYRARLRRLRAAAVERGAPCIVETTLSTLGGRWVADAAHDPRYINYHHGAVSDLCYADDPIVERSERDPLHALACRYAPADWRQLVAEVRATLDADMA